MKHKLLVCVLMLLAASGAVAKDEPKDDGVKVGKASALRNLVPAEGLEKQAALQYNQLKQEMGAKKALAPLEPGAILDVEATDPAALKDFPAFCEMTGNVLLESTAEGEVLRFRIRKGEAAR